MVMVKTVEGDFLKKRAPVCELETIVKSDHISTFSCLTGHSIYRTGNTWSDVI